MSAHKETPFLKPFVAIVRARLTEFLRRPEAVFWVYFFPILMVLVLGTAFRNKKIETISVDVAAGPGTPAVVAVLEKNSHVNFAVRTPDECRQRLRSGQSDFYVSTESSTLSQVHYHFDPTRPGSVATKAELDRLLQVAHGRVDPVKTVEHEMNEPGSRYIDFLVPGLLGMGLMSGGLWGVGYGIVDMRIRKLLKRLMATPMRKRDFLLGIMTSRLFFIVPEIVLLLAFSWWIFDVRIYGNLVAVFFLIILGAFVFSGLGLLVASRAKSIETVSGLMNLVMLPLWTLSGIFFSTEHFPEVVQPLVQVLPLTALNDALRAVINQGMSIWSQWLEIVIMLAWGSITFVVALWIFRWND